LFLLTGALLTLASCGSKKPCELPYTCPAVSGYDCMPPVALELQDVCGGACHDWIVQHCPGVGFTY
jgi:hypothetical protein